MQNITVIGLGGMGSALASTLLDAGYRVTVWNRTAAKTDPLVEAGATSATSVSDAVNASPVIITCIGTHVDTHALLSGVTNDLSGKQFIELSTGSMEEATALQSMIKDCDADCVIGAIQAYPSGIGQPDTTILVSGSETVWKHNESVIKSLGPTSNYIGDNVAALATLFSGLFLPRQGFMFGMIYGAMIAEKAGIPAKTYFEQVPAAMKLVKDYIQVASETITSEDYSNRGASVNVYQAAYKDMLTTFEQLGVSTEMPALMYKLIEQGIDAGLGEEELPSLIKVLREQSL